MLRRNSSHCVSNRCKSRAATCIRNMARSPVRSSGIHLLQSTPKQCDYFMDLSDSENHCSVSHCNTVVFLSGHVQSFTVSFSAGCSLPANTRPVSNVGIVISKMFYLSSVRAGCQYGTSIDDLYVSVDINSRNNFTHKERNYSALSTRMIHGRHFSNIN